MRHGLSAHVRIVGFALGLVLLLLTLSLVGCGGADVESAVEPIVAADEHDPAVWGAMYPEIYRTYTGTADPRPPGLSVYKRGFDDGVMFDKLSEYPFMPLLFKGWGFGIDYQEP
ncbi:MAG: ammonia-forming cytochrome c nitrite reductase subunit c552, partial [Coriobacteriia bacterium]|nr:ammonia-forming cytochrome c nitrite reductase subunit c552 [Coriobacteriia bacterium]